MKTIYSQMFLPSCIKIWYETWTRSVFVCAVVLAVGAVYASGQSMCPIKTIKVGKLLGKVVERSDSASPLQNVSIELRSTDEAQSLIATTTTDKDGGFRFSSVKNGKYSIDFRPEWMESYRLVVKLRSSGQTRGGSFVVKLDLDCGKNEVLLDK